MSQFFDSALLHLAAHKSKYPLSKQGFVDPAAAQGAGDPAAAAAGGGGDPAAGMAAMMGGGMAPPGDPAAMGGGPDPAMESRLAAIEQQLAAGGGGAAAGGVEPIKPKIDVNVEIMQMKKILARIADSLGVQIPAAEMVATPGDLTQMAQGENAAGAAPPPSPIQPIGPIAGASPDAAAAGGGAAAGGVSEKASSEILDRGRAIRKDQTSRAALALAEPTMAAKAAALAKVLNSNASTDPQ